MNISGHVEWNVELNQETLLAPRWSKGDICSIIGPAEGIKLKIFRDVDGCVEPKQKRVPLLSSSVAKMACLQYLWNS